MARGVKKGRHQPPLTAPQLTPAGHQAIAQQQLAHDIVGLKLVVVVGVADVDVAHVVGMDDQEHLLRSQLEMRQVAIFAPGSHEKAQLPLAPHLTETTSFENATDQAHTDLDLEALFGPQSDLLDVPAAPWQPMVNPCLAAHCCDDLL
jgi:hypothetical protein